MFSRVLGIPVILGAAVAVPYFSKGTDGIKEMWNSASASAPADVEIAKVLEARHFDPLPQGPGHEIYPISTPLEGDPSISLEEVFRFDVTKEWVYQRWARKSTALAELGLYGVRVPLVSGTQIHDVAGSLTYFFDRAGQVQRISFKGHTGDTTRVVALAQQKGLQQQISPIVGEQLFQMKRGDDVFSEVRTKPSAVLWSSSPHDSFAVEMDLQRPEATTPLPPKLAPLPEVKEAATTAKAAGAAEAEAPAEQKSFSESLKTFFPRSRIPAEQVKNLERQDRIW